MLAPDALFEPIQQRSSNVEIMGGLVQTSKTDLREQQTVRIALSKAPQTYWVLSFVDEDGGRQTRLESTAGSYPSEHALALARACAA